MEAVCAAVHAPSTSSNLYVCSIALDLCDESRRLVQVCIQRWWRSVTAVTAAQHDAPLTRPEPEERSSWSSQQPVAHSRDSTTGSPVEGSVASGPWNMNRRPSTSSATFFQRPQQRRCSQRSAAAGERSSTVNDFGLSHAILRFRAARLSWCHVR